MSMLKWNFILENICVLWHILKPQDCLVVTPRQLGDPPSDHIFLDFMQLLGKIQWIHISAPPPEGLRPFLGFFAHYHSLFVSKFLLFWEFSQKTEVSSSTLTAEVVEFHTEQFCRIWQI